MLREPGPTPFNPEPLHGRPWRAATTSAGVVALANATHVPAPTDRETSWWVFAASFVGSAPFSPEHRTCDA